MNLRIRTFGILLCLTLLPAGGLFAKDKWISVTSPHFWAISNTNASKAKKLLKNLEEFRWVFIQLFGLQELDQVPIRVYIFKGRSSFRPFQPLYEGKPRDVAGYFLQGQDYHSIALDAGFGGDPLKTIYHEYVHFLTSRTPQPLPLWLTEGLAEFYSTFEVSGREVLLGAPIPYHAEYLQRKSMLTLEQLFGVGHDSPDYNEGSKQGVFYAQSWALVHYLMMDDQASHRPQLMQWVNLLSEGADQQEAYHRAFDFPLSELERELRRYISLAAVYTTVTELDEIEAAKQIETARLEEADSQALLGDLLLHANRLEEAQAYYEQARTLDPTSPRVLEGLGLLALRRDEYDTALEYLKGAAESDTSNYLIHFRYAEGLMTKSGLLEGKESVTEEEFELISRHLRRASELMPAFSHAHYLLSLLHARTGKDPQAGLKAVEKALQLKPQDPYYRITKTELQLAAGDRPAARQTLQRLAAQDDFRVQRFVQTQLEYLDYLDRMDSMPAELSGWENLASKDDADPRDSERMVPAPRPRPDEPWSRSAETSPTPEAKPDPQPEQPSCRPSFTSVQGAPRLPGRILRVECEQGLVYVVEINGEETLLVGPPGQVILYSCEVPLTEFTCGPFEYDATVYFVPGWEKDPETGAFKALAIELRLP